MSTAVKPSNPKEAIGDTKLPMHLVPPVVEIYGTLGFLEGALKYGKFNWRAAGVRFSTYINAMKRHLAKLQDGEWADKKTKVPHLANIIACCGIILDARHVGKLNDDRSPAAPTSDLIDGLIPAIAELKKLFEDHHPHQHTIQDDPNGDYPGRESQTGDRLPARRSRSVLPQAGATRHGKAVPRLPRRASR